MMPRDPSSPTAVEQGFGQVPCPPSTNSSTSGRNDTQGNGVFGGKGPSLQGVGVQPRNEPNDARKCRNVSVDDGKSTWFSVWNAVWILFAT